MKPGTPFALVRGNNEEANELLLNGIREELSLEPDFCYDVGCIISLNTGPNMVAIIFRK